MSKKQLYTSPNVSENFNSSTEYNNDKKPDNMQKQINKKKIASSSEAGSTSKQKLLQGKENTEKKSKQSENVGSEADSDSDSGDIDMFFKKSELKLPYTKDEDELIVNYVLKGDNIYKTSSILLWKFLERKKTDPKRTYQSLKNRFLRNIKPNLFTKYRHLIKDSGTVNRILAKYPELKNSLQKRPALSAISFPMKEKKGQPAKALQEKKESEVIKEMEERLGPAAVVSEDTSVSSTIDVEEGVKVELPAPQPLLQSQPLISSPEFFHAKVHPRKVASKNDSIVVTVDLEKYSLNEKPASAPLGIYQKFLKHKKTNVVATCSECGRGGVENDCSDDSDTDCQDRPDTASPSRKPSKPRRDHLPRKRRRKTPSPTSKSPSLLSDDFRDIPPPSPEKKKKASQEFLTDKDLESLYLNMVAFCRTFTGLDDRESQD